MSNTGYGRSSAFNWFYWYYNLVCTYLKVEGCSRSGMFKAFSEYILDGLSIKRERKAKVCSNVVSTQQNCENFHHLIRGPWHLLTQIVP